MPNRTDQAPDQHTPVTEDAHATVPQLLARAAQDYANGWGQPDVRATAENDGGR